MNKLSIIGLFLSLFNTALSAFVGWKVYAMFYKEVGFYLPTLTILNFFAISMIIEIYTSNISVLLEVWDIKKNDAERDKSRLSITLKRTVYYVILLGFAYLYKIILY